MLIFNPKPLKSWGLSLALALSDTYGREGQELDFMCPVPPLFPALGISLGYMWLWHSLVKRLSHPTPQLGVDDRMFMVQNIRFQVPSW